MPLDNTGSLAVSADLEGATRTEQVVELVRKKQSFSVGDLLRENNPSVASAETEFSRSLLAGVPQVSLPRDLSKPLLTSSDRYAKEALDAYNSLRSRLLKWQTAKGASSVAVTSVGRCEGKTLTAFNLACCCAYAENLSVLLIDADLRNRSLTHLVAGLPSFGFADVISGHASWREAVAKTDLNNLFLMGAGKAAGTSVDISSNEKWSELLQRARQHFNLVVVDALSLGTYADFDLIAPECDGVLLVVRARTTSREGLKTALRQVDANKLVGVVWNGFES